MSLVVKLLYNLLFLSVSPLNYEGTEISSAAIQNRLLIYSKFASSIGFNPAYINN